MTSSNPLRMRKSEKILLAGNLLLLATTSPAIQVEGITNQQMQFRGIIRNTSNGFIELSDPTNESMQQFGIPIADIAELHPVGAIDSDDIMEDIYQNQAILHLWDTDTHIWLIEYLESWTLKKEWTRCYHGSVRMESALSSHPLRQRIHLIKAWSLFEMGLPAQSQLVLNTLDAYLDHTNAPTRYCWLKAKLARLADDTEMATYWSLLPMLRIPSDTSELALELYEACELPPKLS